MISKPWIAAAGVTLLALSAGAPVLAANSTSAKTKSLTHSSQVTWNGKSELTVETLTAPDPHTKQQTIWVRADNAASVIGFTGLTAHWILGVRQLFITLPMGQSVPTGMSVPYHKTASGQFVTIVNAKTIAYGPIYVKQNAAKDVYLPISYLDGILGKLGIHAKWTGSTWALTGPSASVKSTPVSNDDSNSDVPTFQLQLANQSIAKYGVTDLPVPPANPVQVSLPLNPSLKPSSAPFPDAVESIPVEGYIQTGSKVFVSKESISTLEAWFQHAFQSMGYQQSGSGSMGNINTGEYAEGLTFSPKGNGKEMPPLNVTVSFQTQKDNETLIKYWVTDLVLPPRPASSLLPDSVNRIDITLTSTQTGGIIKSSGSTVTQPQAPQTAVVTDAKQITDLVTAVNSLTEIDPPSVHSSPANLTIDRAKLQFTLADGSTIDVTAVKAGALDSFTVGNIPLKDPKGSVWTALTSIMKNMQQSGQ